jgi:hypothetical protein
MRGPVKYRAAGLASAQKAQNSGEGVLVACSAVSVIPIPVWGLLVSTRTYAVHIAMPATAVIHGKNHGIRRGLKYSASGPQRSSSPR